MEAQGLSEGSLRNSHRETHAVRRKPASAKVQQRASALVESCSQDLVIRQRLDLVRMEPVLKRCEFHVMTNEGRADPGYVVILPGQPVVYLQMRRGRPPMASTLRMRVAATLTEGGGSVLIGTLDNVLHSLRLEDVWMWRGACLGQTSYSKRREKLKEFVEHHWIPDARLMGGIFTSIAQPISLEKFAERTDWNGVSSVEFIPETPGRRRLVWHLEEMVRAATGPAAEKKVRDAPAISAAPAVTAPAVTAPAAPAPTQVPRRVRAVPVDKLPDVYDLYDESGQPLSRASVQQFSLSQQLRGKEEAWVLARWRSEFGGYEIIRLA